MSSFTLIGFFALAGGKCVVSTKSSKVHYCFYTTSIQCTAGIDIPAEIHIYSPYNDVPHPKDTIAFVIAKAFCPPNDTALLNAYHLIPVPGNPTETEYQMQHVPDCPYPFVSGIGAVSSTEVLPDGVTKAFSVLVGDYIRDGTKSSTVQCTFNSSKPQWSNTPLPNANSSIHFFGTVADVSSAGTICIDIENIAMNIGPNTNESASPQTSKTLPVKRCRFNAIAMNLPKSPSLHQNIPSSPTSNAASSSSVPRQPTPSLSRPIPIGATPLISSLLSSSDGTMVTAPSLAPSAIPSPVYGAATLDMSCHSHDLSIGSPLSDGVQSPIDPACVSTSTPPLKPTTPALSVKAHGKRKAIAPKDVE
ncbi:hypothetical protein SCLCIDRAFT_29026 [Scleroderma citrinum Foug A]|uniref:Uncharacterized protein n=1 Tax=Scleroderma citrinum Foug A TaxID=1036808 RepID=A0A0C3DMC2_9AGAM|nr:hypothetical protein SCLCIDRAFT_29026 [Scleroderma citrinum Foug A]